MIAFHHKTQPCERGFAQFRRVQPSALLDVEHRGQVAFFEMHLLEKILRLLLRRDVWFEIMVRAAQKSVLACFVKVLVEILVLQAAHFSGFNDYEEVALSVDFCL